MKCVLASLLALLALLFTLELASASPTASTPDQQRIRQLEEEVARLKAQVAALQDENRRLMVLAAVVPAEDRAQAAQQKMQVQTDQAGNLTSAKSPSTALVITGGTHADHEFSLTHEEGVTTLKIQGFYSGDIHRNVAMLELTIDGQAASVPLAKYRRIRQEFGTRVTISAHDEILTFTIPPALIAQLGQARSAQGTLGGVTFNFTLDQLALFKALDARLTTPTPAVNP